MRTMSLEIGVQLASRMHLSSRFQAFISDALRGSWFGADKGQLDPFTQLHSLVGESGQFCQTARGKGMPPPDQRPSKVCVSVTLGVADTGRHALVPITASRG